MVSIGLNQSTGVFENDVFEQLWGHDLLGFGGTSEGFGEPHFVGRLLGANTSEGFGEPRFVGRLWGANTSEGFGEPRFVNRLLGASDSL